MPEQQQYFQQYQPFMQTPYFDPYGAMRGYLGYNNPAQAQNAPQQQQEAAKKANFVYRPVGGIEEARAAQIEWDGTVYYFEDKAAGTIYRKQYIGETVTFSAFGMIELPAPEIPQTTDEVARLTVMVEALSARLEMFERGITAHEQQLQTESA